MGRKHAASVMLTSCASCGLVQHPGSLPHKVFTSFSHYQTVRRWSWENAYITIYIWYHRPSGRQKRWSLASGALGKGQCALPLWRFDPPSLKSLPRLNTPFPGNSFLSPQALPTGVPPSFDKGYSPLHTAASIDGKPTPPPSLCSSERCPSSRLPRASTPPPIPAHTPTGK